MSTTDTRAPGAERVIAAAIAGEAGASDHDGNLRGELAGAELIQLAGDRVASLGEPGGLRRKGGDLALGERLGVDPRGERLDRGHVKELDDSAAEGGLRAGGLAVAQRGLDRLDAEPVAAALIAQQVAPAAGPPGLTLWTDAEDVGAGAGDRPDAGLGARRGGPGRDNVVDDDPV